VGGPSDPSGDQLAALQRELDDARTALQQLGAQNTALQSEVTRLTQQLAAKEAALADLQKQNTTLLTQIAMFEQQVKALQDELSKLQAQVAALSAENAKLKSELAGYAGYKEKMDALTQQVASLTSALDAANLTLDSLIKRLMTGRTDANVAAVARDAAKQQVALAIAKRGTRDPRVRHAQKELAHGEEHFRRGQFQRSLKDFDQAYDIARRIVR
jgi:chromosome segregation ATPase